MVVSLRRNKASGFMKCRETSRKAVEDVINFLFSNRACKEKILQIVRLDNEESDLKEKMLSKKGVVYPITRSIEKSEKEAKTRENALKTALTV